MTCRPCATVTHLPNRGRRARTAFAIAAVIAGTMAPAFAGMITTRYQYNADGEPVAASVSRNGGTETTTYFTWDNFVPDYGDASRGTVRRGSGNLIGVGPRPGEDSSAMRLSFDRRDRLRQCTPSGGPAVSFTYDARSWLEGTTLSTGDEQRFYYGADPHVTNQRQPSTQTSTGFLGPVRYLTDGREQVLVSPRKDTAASYEPGSELLNAYGADPFGGPRSQNATREGLSSDATQYDLGDNPFRYTGEYRDPSCGIYNLRARWYLPEYQMFISRDPVDPVHRYGYTGGNPINRTDPSGLSYRGYQRFVGKAMKKLTPAGVTALSALPWIGPAMMLFQTSAAGAFWHDPSATATLGFQVISAGVLGGLEGSVVDRVAGTSRAFVARNLAEGVSGIGQAAISSTDRRGHIAPKAFGEAIGATAASIVLGRMVVGIGYRPFNLSATAVDDQVAAHFAGRDYKDQTVLVYRVKARLARGRVPFPFTSPVGEALGLGVYHEALVGVGEHSMHYADMRATQINRDTAIYREYASNHFGRDVPSVHWSTEKGSRPEGYTAFQFAGIYQMADVDRSFETAPGARGYLSLREQEQYATNHGGRAAPSPYNLLTNNCHDFAASILTALGH